MPKVVPSQVVEVIDQTFSEAKKQMPFYIDRGRRNEAAAIIELVDQIPTELIKLDTKDYTIFQLAVTAIKNTLPLWVHENYDLGKIKGYQNRYLTLLLYPIKN